ncbi:PII protein [Klebsormidium nitens]|uniref:PII protein n=1 Tax=Klebsormidium nitens TaxID=105231 RepID=A0A1Y1HJU4_KLENI|nr:PII protein [Klebsormidium nitens]|eukprot:GAQ78815.1 PII protein [Klebsormidium nitens]
MATSTLCRLQGLERTLSPAVNGPTVDPRGSVLPLTNAIQLRRSPWGGLPVLSPARHLQRSRKSSKKGQLICRAESGENNAPKQSTLEHIPKAPFYKVEAVIRSWRLQGVTEALLAEGIRGLTVLEVKGFGAQRGSLERQAGSEFLDSAFLQKTKIEIVVVADQVDPVIDTIIDAAKTEEIGDGKIFVSPVYEVIRVRTGERGVDAERMAGGRSDLLNLGQKD